MRISYSKVIVSIICLLFLLILLFAMGHCLPIMIAGSSTAAVRRLTESEL